MNPGDFSENLDAELAPFSDSEVDAIFVATEANWRYRVEFACILVGCAVIPIAPAVLGLAAIRAYGLSGLPLLLAGVLVIGCIYGFVRLAKLLARPLVTWRYRASFLRQLAAHRSARGL